MIPQTQHLYQTVDFLTSLRPFRTYDQPLILARVVDYIQDYFLNAGLLVELQKWQVHGQEYVNVIAYYNPGKDSRLVVGAHYDVCGDQPGADDNASAVAGLLETARQLSLHQPQLDYTIELVAYCLEEPPYFGTEHMGSFVHARSLFEAAISVKGMICYEMIGYFSDTPGSQSYPIPEMYEMFPSEGNFIGVVGIDAQSGFVQAMYRHMAACDLISVFPFVFPDGNYLAYLSDQSNYWHFGYNALMINDTSFLRNPNYHQASDTIDTLDFSRMAAVVNSVVYAMLRL